MKRSGCRGGSRTAPTFIIFFLLSGCATLFGWDIHAPGILSADYYNRVQPVSERVALYLPPQLVNYESKNRGSKTADPQTYHIGEAFAPMLIEGFQGAFDEFIYLEVEPTAEILKQYGIRYAVVVRVKDFGNRVTWKGQGLSIQTESAVLDSDLKMLARFESTGSNESQKIFAKKGGPEVNLNAALENNILSIVQFLQDGVRNGTWEKKTE